MGADSIARSSFDGRSADTTMVPGVAAAGAGGAIDALGAGSGATTSGAGMVETCTAGTGAGAAAEGTVGGSSTGRVGAAGGAVT